MDIHDDDPALVEAIARRDESRAQILRSKANAAGGSSSDRLAAAFEKLADQAEKASQQSAAALDNIEPVRVDPEGTARSLADTEGNFAANAQVAATGGIGIDASNTNVATGEPAQTAADAGVVVTADAQKIIGDQVVGAAATSPAPETDDTRAAVVIVDGWRDLTWQERRSIASKVSDTPIANGEEANAAIEAELKRRG